MGQKQGKTQLFKAVETDNLTLTQNVMKQFPELLEEPLAGNNSATPLQRVSWRGNLDIVMYLCEIGAQVDHSDQNGITPLMWATKRDHPQICVVLIKSGADPRRRSKEGLNAIDYAILHGNYASAYIMFEFDKNIQTAESYMIINKMKLWRWVNFEDFIQALMNGVTPQKAPNFFQKPPGRIFQDPVIDPRETWGGMMKRIINFDPPPLCERADLPERLQPQNRMLGRMSSYINGIDPQPRVGRSNTSYELEATGHNNNNQ